MINSWLGQWHLDSQKFGDSLKFPQEDASQLKQRAHSGSDVCRTGWQGANIRMALSQ